jgi:hypothetical protein
MKTEKSIGLHVKTVMMTASVHRRNPHLADSQESDFETVVSVTS